MAFLSENPEVTREPSVLDDAGNLLKSGAYDVGASILELPASGLGLGLAAGLRDRWRQLAQEEYQKVNPALQKQINEFGVEWNNGDPRFKEGSTWQGALGAAVKSSPSLAPFGGAGLAGRAIAGTAGALIGYGGSNTLMMGGDAAHQARQEALQQGATPEDAERRAMEAYANVAPHAFASGALAGPMEEAILLKGGQGKIIPNMLKGGATEGGQEFYESGAQQRAVNQALGRDEWQGVGDAALTGMAIGTLSGGGMSASSASINKGLQLLKPDANIDLGDGVGKPREDIPPDAQATDILKDQPTADFTNSQPQLEGAAQWQARRKEAAARSADAVADTSQEVSDPSLNKVVTDKGPVDAIPLVGDTVNPVNKSATLRRNPAPVFGDGLEPVGKEMPYTLDDLNQEGYVEGATTPDPQFAAKANALKSKFKFGKENRIQTGSEIDQRIETMNSPQQLEKFLASREAKLARLDQVIEQLRVTGDESALQDALDLRDLQVGENAYARGRLEDILQGRPVYNGFERMKGDVGPPDNVMVPQGRPEGNTVQNQTIIDVVRPEKDSLLTAIAKLGGVNREDVIGQGIDPADLNRRGYKIFRAFTNTGETLDGLVPQLQDQGYNVTDANDLWRQVHEELNGRKQYAPAGLENVAQSMYDDYADTQQQMAEAGYEPSTGVDFDAPIQQAQPEAPAQKSLRREQPVQQPAQAWMREPTRAQKQARLLRDMQAGANEDRMKAMAALSAEDSGILAMNSAQTPAMQAALNNSVLVDSENTAQKFPPKPLKTINSDGTLLDVVPYSPEADLNEGQKNREIVPEQPRRTLDQQTNPLRAARIPAIEDVKPGFNPEALLQPETSGDLASKDFVEERSAPSAKYNPDDAKDVDEVADHFEGDLNLRHQQTNTSWISRNNNEAGTRVDKDRPGQERAFERDKVLVNRDALKPNELSMRNPPQPLVDNLVEAVHFGDVSFRRDEDRSATLADKAGDVKIEAAQIADPSTGKPITVVRAVSPNGVIAEAIPHPNGGYQIRRQEAVANPLGSQERIDDGRIQEAIKIAKRSAKQFNPTKEKLAAKKQTIYVKSKDGSKSYPLDTMTVYKLGKALASEPMTDAEYFQHGLTEIMNRENVMLRDGIPDNVIIRKVKNGEHHIPITYGEVKQDRKAEASHLQQKTETKQAELQRLQDDYEVVSTRKDDALKRLNKAVEDKNWGQVSIEKRLYRGLKSDASALVSQMRSLKEKIKNSKTVESEFDPRISRDEAPDMTDAPPSTEAVKTEARETELRNAMIKEAKQREGNPRTMIEDRAVRSDNWFDEQIDSTETRGISKDELQREADLEKARSVSYRSQHVPFKQRSEATRAQIPETKPHPFKQRREEEQAKSQQVGRENILKRKEHQEKIEAAQAKVDTGSVVPTTPIQASSQRNRSEAEEQGVTEAENYQVKALAGTKLMALDKSGRDLTRHYQTFISRFTQDILGLRTKVSLSNLDGVRALVSRSGEIQKQIDSLSESIHNIKTALRTGKTPSSEKEWKTKLEKKLKGLEARVAALETQKAFLREMNWSDAPAKFIALKGAVAEDNRLIIYLSDGFDNETARFQALTHELGHYIQKAALDRIINQALFDSYQRGPTEEVDAETREDMLKQLGSEAAVDRALRKDTDAIRTVKELFGFDEAVDLSLLSEGEWQKGEERFAEMLRAWFKSYNPASKRSSNEALAKADTLVGKFFNSIGEQLYKLWEQAKEFFRLNVQSSKNKRYLRNMENFDAFIEAITDVTGKGQARSAKSKMYATVLGEVGQSYNPALKQSTQQNFSPLRVMARSKQVAQYAATQGLDTLAALDPVWRPLDEQMKRMDSPLGNVLRKAFHIAPGDTANLTAAEQVYADAVADLKDGTYYDQMKLYSAPFWNRLGKLVKDLPQKKNFWNRKDPQAGQAQARIAKALLAETPDNQLTQTLSQAEADQVKEVRQYLKDIYTKLHQMGVAWQYRQNYFPHIQNHEEMEKRHAEYVNILMQHEGLNNQEAMKRYREELARGQMLMLSQYDPSIDIRNSSFGFRPPRPFSLQTQRALRDADFYVNDIGAVLYNYTHMAFKFGVQAKMFGNHEVDPVTGATKFRINGRINDAINRAVLNGDLTIEQANWLRNKALPAYFGTLGAEMPSRLRAVQSTLMTGVNMALLAFSTLSSIPELGQIDVRSGRLGSSMKEAYKVLSDKQYRRQLQQVASAIGTIREDLVEHALTGALDNSWMIPSMQKVNHAYFKWIGQKHWTDFTRTVALGLAQEALTEYAASNNQAALDELRISAAEINAWNQAGRPIPTDTSFAKIGHALNAWVDQAVIRPNPALRPVYGSNPYSALVWHLKDYMWGMYSIVWKRVWHMARVEPRKVAKALPFLLMGAALMPLAMLATELRRILTDEIPAGIAGTSARKRKEGADYWLDVVERSGMPAQVSVLMRAAQDAENNENVLTSVSPVADTFQNFLSKPASYSTARMVPLLGSMPAFRKEVFGSPF